MRKLKCTLCGLLALLAPSAPAADAPSEDVWHLLIEPTFMRHEAAWPIPGSQTAVLTPARLVNGEVLPLRRDEVLERGVTRTKILSSAAASAAEVLSTLKPRFVRDTNKVIQYAVLESESPLTASAVLAPGFTSLFTETLGPDILVAIPNRFRIFVFPRDAFLYQSFADLIFVEYQSTPYPVTREIFAIQDGKLLAIGGYR